MGGHSIKYSQQIKKQSLDPSFFKYYIQFIQKK
jgi:hypothetical protein